MPDRTILVYSLVDLGITAGNYNFSTIATGGSFTVAAGAAPSVATVSDIDNEDTVFNDGLPNSQGGFAQAPTQVLTGNIDGTAFSGAPTNPENEFEVFDSSGASVGFIYDLHNANSSSFASLQGYVTTFELIPGETYTVGPANGLGNATYNDLLTCFVSGTHIVTRRGEVAIENLQPGDEVMTRDNGLQTIRWIGATTVRGLGKFAPITFREGALGNTRDLQVSPLHRMLLTGWQAELLFGEAEVLANAKHLVNGDTIFSAPCEQVTYYHMLFDQHEIVFAEGCPSESFFPGPATLGSVDHQVREELFALFPELATIPESYGPTARRCLRGKEAALVRVQKSL
ncbi:Hint domain-containing protein [Halocynthiibacter styelae]|uniref:Hint domain-containing protein n=1 Tax=Halocynthiibacter styelae TaxID=2761955 RepID=A0A8J7IWD2_9RHOB|nr:Hint domain-containing protein [Paenihalocynthiibacter styelae]MBI1493030.1 Hint domain-containing protein [Paenihalocynthiibacter styelae]